VAKKSPLHPQDRDLVKLLSKHIPSALGVIVAEYLRYRPVFVTGGREIPRLAMLYSPSSNTWTKMPDTKYKHYFAAAVNFKNRIMVMSGNDESCFSHKNVEMYDPDLEQWVDVAPLTQDRSVPTACVCNDKVYVLGGQSSSCSRTLNTVERYDEKENKWEFVAPMSRTRLRAVSFSLNGKVYVCGGSPDISNRHTDCHNDCEMYDPDTNTWTQMASMPISVTYASAAVRNGKAYVGGGSSLNDGDTPLKDVLEYDPDKNEWKRIPPMNEGRSYIPALVNTDEGLMIIGGWQSHESDGCVLERYDDQKELWVKTTHTGEKYAECPDVKFGICAVAMTYNG
jgi:N-acetylneuraminic acid mutarotase